MKLIRFGEVGSEKPGVLLNDGIRLDIPRFALTTTNIFLPMAVSMDCARLAQIAILRRRHGFRIPFGLAHPFAVPAKSSASDLNFRDHAAESKMDPPKEPVIFFKSTTSLVGPNDDLKIPRNAEKVDWEVEFAVVIEKKATYVSESQALDYVAGFALHNDYSERSFQLERGGQWVKGKSADTFAPLGPFLATRDELPNFDRLAMWFKVNGEFRQRSSTSEMIFRRAVSGVLRQSVHDAVCRAT